MFKYDKSTLFAEFKIAKDKDISLSKKTSEDEKENDIHTNRIQFFRDHIKLKSEKPSIYSDLDINFDKLLSVYLTPSPRDTFYRAIFGMSYAEKKADEERQSILEDIEDRKLKAKQKTEYVEEVPEVSEVVI